MILNDYVRCSMDFMPYSFFNAHRTSAMASTNAAEPPLVKVDLQAYDGTKQYLKVSYYEF